MNVIFIYKASSDGKILAHPVHRYWEKQVQANTSLFKVPDIFSPVNKSFLRDLIAKFTNDISDRADIYIFEEPSTLYMLPKLHTKSPDSIKIYLETNWRRYLNARDNSDDSIVYGAAKKINNHVDIKILNKYINKYIDGFLTVSRMLRNRLKNKFRKPAGIVRPIIRQEKQSQLVNVQPDHSNNKAVVVCKNRYHKGVERLVRKWAAIRKRFPEAELNIVGSGHPDYYDKFEGINRHGYVEDLQRVFDNSSLYVHPAI
ncbi:MAG: glycosyltransferase, partial [Halobacteriaceae archaeon]